MTYQNIKRELEEIMIFSFIILIIVILIGIYNIDSIILILQSVPSALQSYPTLTSFLTLILTLLPFIIGLKIILSRK